jgi:hypothetical protein
MVGLAPKRQRPEARGAPLSYYHGPIGALSPLAGGWGDSHGVEFHIYFKVGSFQQQKLVLEKG